MNRHKQKNLKREIRHKRVRALVSGALERPRLSVFRANKHIYAQLIDDEAGKTLAMASTLELSAKGGSASGGKIKAKKSDAAKEVGKLLATKALEKNIKAVKFDRGGFAYHGRVKALAEGAREGGLQF